MNNRETREVNRMNIAVWTIVWCVIVWMVIN